MNENDCPIIPMKFYFHGANLNYNIVHRWVRQPHIFTKLLFCRCKLVMDMPDNWFIYEKRPIN